MLTSLLGYKKEQGQRFTGDGRRIPVTTIVAGPSWITRVEHTPSLKRIEIGFGIAKHLTKAQEGHQKKAGLPQKLRFLRSVKVSEIGEQDKPGTEVHIADIFSPGDRIMVSGISKGKGFAGGVKRHGFAGGPRTHGQSDRERAPGSIGQTTTPGRVYRGKRMAGRMGNDRVTVRGLSVVAVDSNTHTITVQGLVPGPRESFLIIRKER
ncbi:50S ribosomal protein L3 [Patescibacteria group bacterium]|nr:50S ribosomal protein L3 [Patescibacteria group bacterium]